MILLVVWICGAVFYSHAPEQQDNSFMVGQTEYKADLSKLPKEELEAQWHPKLQDTRCC